MATGAYVTVKAEDLQEGDMIFVRGREQWVAGTTIIEPSPTAGLEFDDFRGSGDAYVFIGYNGGAQGINVRREQTFEVYRYDEEAAV